MKYSAYPAYKDSGVEWLGEIPEHWQAKRLKYLLQGGLVNGLFKKKEQFGSGAKLVNVVDLYQDTYTVNFESLERVKAEQQEIEAYQVLPGDIFFVRSSLKLEGVGASACVSKVPEPTVFECHLVRVRPCQKWVLPKYLINYLNASLTRQRLVALAETTTMTTIAQPKLGTIEVVVPPLPEQQTIASFLDRETAKIDALIAKKERLIELLQEKRTAIISHAVTKGIDPTVLLKDSGVEWLGKIPTHWQVKRIRAITESIQTGPFGSQLHSEEYVSGGIPVINPSHLKDGRIEPDWDCAVDKPTWQRLSRHELREGDIIFARRGEMGRCALVTAAEAGWLCGTGSLRMRLKLDVAYPQFLNWILSTSGVRDWLLLESVGATMDNLNTTILARVPLSVPPFDEQVAIASYLDRETAKIDALIAKIREGIEKLKEYRTVLISSAVTGTIDVRELTD